MAAVWKQIHYFTFPTTRFDDLYFHFYLFHFRGENMARLHGKNKDYPEEQQARK